MTDAIPNQAVIDELTFRLCQRDQCVLIGEFLAIDTADKHSICFRLESQSDNHNTIDSGAASLLVDCQNQQLEVQGSVVNNDTVRFTFADSDSLQVRMLLQLMNIQSYFKKSQQSGADISTDEAAKQWTEQFAEEFAQLFDAKP